MDARNPQYSLILLLLLANRLPALAQGPPALKVVGNQLRTADGRVARLRGVNIPSLEWDKASTCRSRSRRPSAIGGPTSFACRCRRTAGSGTRRTRRTAASIIARPRDFVDKAAGLNCYVILDLHWNDGGVWGQHIGQHKMPDDLSLEFWKAAAAAYAGQSNVLLGLYNEPHDIPWQVWQDGGHVSEADKKIAPGGKLEYRTPGMQKLLGACRAGSAENVAVVGGLDWAYDLTGIVKGHALSDPKGNGVVYDTHIYPMKKWFTHGTTKSQDWDRLLLPTAAKYPGHRRRIRRRQGQLRGQGAGIRRIRTVCLGSAGACTRGAKPCLIKDWNYTPTVFGELVKKSALRGADAKRSRRCASRARLSLYRRHRNRALAGNAFLSLQTKLDCLQTVLARHGGSRFERIESAKSLTASASS